MDRDEYKSSYKEKDRHKHHKSRSRSRSRDRSRGSGESGHRDSSHSSRHHSSRDETKEERRARKDREKYEKRRSEDRGVESTSRGFGGYPDAGDAAYQPPQYTPAGGAAPYPTGGYTSQDPQYGGTGGYGASDPSSQYHSSSGYVPSGDTGSGYVPPLPPKSPSHHSGYDQPQHSPYPTHDTTSGLGTGYGTGDYSQYPAVPPKSPSHGDQYSSDPYGASKSPGLGQTGPSGYPSTTDYSGYSQPQPPHGTSPGHPVPYGPPPSDSYQQQQQQEPHYPGGFPTDYSAQPHPDPQYSSHSTGAGAGGVVGGVGYDGGYPSHESQGYQSQAPYDQQQSYSAQPGSTGQPYGGAGTGDSYQSGAYAGQGQAGADYSQGGPGGQGYVGPPAYSATGGSLRMPDLSSYPEAPRNPLGSNYHARAEPNAPPPQEYAPMLNLEEGEYEQTGTEFTRPLSSSKGAKSFLSNFPAALHQSLHDIARQFSSSAAASSHFHTHLGSKCTHPDHLRTDNRFHSFAEVRRGNMAKWFVDGKDYSYAVSCALEKARKSIWILDWWCSPELYLRRPPAQNEQYRLDRMLQAAAQRGVQVNIIVYKEVTQALTLSSAHTKHALEELHPNIAVFRHPDHLPDRISIAESIKNSVTSGDATIGGAISGALNLDDKVVLYWAHHEKLCLIDGDIEGGGIAFMGGLDLCFGRWDLNHHPISDVHPTDVSETIFLGQDYNNGRIMDFHTVDHWEQNKLDRTRSSRMGWSDVALCLTGPAVEDLKLHFVERWNFIYDEKYLVRKDNRYKRMDPSIIEGDTEGFEGGTYTGAYDLKGKMRRFAGRMSKHEDVDEKSRRKDSSRKDKDYDALAFGGDTDSEEDRYQSSKSSKKDSKRRGYEEEARRGDGGRRDYEEQSRGVPEESSRGYEEGSRGYDERAGGHHSRFHFPGYGSESTGHDQQGLGIQCQIVRSASEWSHGSQTEHSIANAYYEIIMSAKFFVYIENQFFITTTGVEGGAVKNKIGEAIVNRILRAHQNQEKFRIVVVMPAVPAFAGDLKDKGSLGIRAIMEFQYDSICRGGKGTSIYERLQAKGINPTDYIRFFNLRNYDRINISSELTHGAQQAGVPYMAAQADLENKYGAGWDANKTQGGEYKQWQNVAKGKESSVWDSVAGCAMLGGGDIRDVPWSGDPEKEIDAFVSEELYIHSKVMIADDRITICGSANLNDRSMAGDHDSEIAIVIEDPTPLASRMNYRDYTASHFAATLRRHLFRKHLGLIPAQTLTTVDDNMIPVPTPNVYDFDSHEDQLVMDPLSDDFWNHLIHTAKTNTDAFAKVFRPVPYDGVLTWKDYDRYYSDVFAAGGTKEKPIPAKYEVGHVVKEGFPSGREGARAVKEVLSKVRGNIVEMPMEFLKSEDIAKESVEFNAFTEVVVSIFVHSARKEFHG